MIKIIEVQKDKNGLICLKGQDCGFGKEFENKLIKISRYDQKIKLIKHMEQSKKTFTGKIIHSMLNWYLVDGKKYYLDIVKRYDNCEWFNIYVGEYNKFCDDNMFDKALYRYNYADYEILMKNKFKDILADYLKINLNGRNMV